MESLIQQSLVELLLSQLPGSSQEDIDSILLSYVLGIAEDLLEDANPAQTFDSGSFMEMLLAYLPQLEGIQEERVREWMLGLLEELHNRQEKKSSSEFNIKLIIEETANKQPTRKSRSVSETSEPEPPSMRREEERGGSESAGLAALLEMFPGCCRLEAVHCLAITRGDPEQAAQLILCRQEQGEDIKLSQAQLLAQLAKPVTVDESEIKKKIMDSYGFVDTENDKKYHRPTLRKGDDKKMIRYREGKIVSTKGERFSQVTKEESEEMKKSIVNILT